jgi:hypothetical protein
MKTTFLNPLVRGPLPSVTPGQEFLDGLGKFQFLDRLFKDLDTLHTAVSDRFDMATERQQKESIFLQELFNEAMLNGFIEKFPTTTIGMIDTIALWLNPTPRLDWETISVFLLDENYQILPGKVNYSIEDNNVLVNAKKAPYTLIHYKLPLGSKTSGLVVKCNPSELVSVNRKQVNTNVWEEVFLLSDFIQKQDRTFIDLPFTEIKVVLKNVTVSENYATYFSAYALNGSKRNIRLPIYWNEGSFANSISINSFNPGQGRSFFEGTVSFDGKSYNTQIPSWMIPVSRLEVVKYTSLSLSTYTILKCPYPVDLNSYIGIFKSLNDYQSSEIVDWEGSLNGIDWVTPNNIDTLSYSVGYTEKPKYFYVRLKGFFETAFIYYYLEKTINCAWPISDDGKLFFNGSGLGLKNPSLAPVSLIGDILFTESDSYNESTPFGSIGID